MEEYYELKSKAQNVEEFFATNFNGAFKLAVPKSLADLAMEADWVIDSKTGVQVFEFDRDNPDGEGKYTMLHMAMVVRRQNPPREERGPGQAIPHDVEAIHRETVTKIFCDEVISVDTLVTGALEKEISDDLDKLFEHRKKYYVEPEE